MRALICCCVLCAGLPLSAFGQDEGEKQARQFWAAWAKAEVKAIEPFYAEKVLLLPGSEFLKKDWGLSDSGDRRKSLLVERRRLMAAYARIFEKEGAKIRQSLAKVPPEKITLTQAEVADKPFPGVRAGDAILKIASGPGGDALWFVFRKGAKGQWQVVAELVD